MWIRRKEQVSGSGGGEGGVEVSAAAPETPTQVLRHGYAAWDEHDSTSSCANYQSHKSCLTEMCRLSKHAQSRFVSVNCLSLKVSLPICEPDSVETDVQAQLVDEY